MMNSTQSPESKPNILGPIYISLDFFFYIRWFCSLISRVNDKGFVLRMLLLFLLMSIWNTWKHACRVSFSKATLINKRRPIIFCKIKWWLRKPTQEWTQSTKDEYCKTCSPSVHHIMSMFSHLQMKKQTNTRS